VTVAALARLTIRMAADLQDSVRATDF